MKQRTLGKRNLVVSSLGLGCVSFTDFYGTEFDLKEAEATVQRALELGITLFDVADVYGNGANEELLARALKGKRQQAVISTKFGFLYTPDGKMTGISGKPSYVKEACDRSLKRLNSDYIDLYFQHRVDRETPIEETVGAMADLVREGKVRHIGLCEASSQTLRRANAVHPVAALQSEYSLWSRDIEGEILATCRELGIGLVAYSPLGRGFLTGQVKESIDKSTGDFRGVLPRFQGDNLRKNVEVVSKVEDLAKEKGCTPSQLALAWLLAQGEDIVPIPGTKRRRYVEQNAAAADVTLTAEDLALLEDISHQFVGTRYSEAGMKMTNA